MVATTVAFGACAGDDSSGEQPEDVTVAPSALNFDAPLVVYEASGDDDDVMDIYLIDPATGDRARLTDGEAFSAGPAWSPDRQRIVFSSTRDGQDETDLYSMARDGSDVRRMTDTPEAEYEPRVSPDGSTVAFVRQDGANWILSLMDAGGSNRRDLTEPMKFIEFPAWRPDGSMIAFAGIEPGGTDSDLISVSPAGGDVATLIATDTADVCPHFTDDGATLLYATIPDGEDQLDVFAHDMTNPDTTTTSDTRLTDDPAKDDYGEPGPDDRVVFVTDRDGNPELYIMNLDGSDQRRLTNTPGLDENLPDW
ncbi:MAG: hypothetical protein WD359_06395 [Dehalococcoidia bacterium]